MNIRNDEYRLGYRGDIEGLRAIAILLVIGAHAGVPWLAGGFVGVDIFFVLSGFLITGLLVQEITDAGTLRFADFYIRRFRRLSPALVVMLLGSSLLASLLLAPVEQMPQATAAVSAAGWWSNIHFALERADYFSASTETNIFLHTWSLGVEEQFYLLWPALVYLLARNKSREIAFSRLRTCMVSVIAMSLVLCVVLTYLQPQLAFYIMPLRAWQFAVGALVWLHFNQGLGDAAVVRVRFSRILVAMGWLGLTALLGAGLLLNANLPYPSFYALIPTLGAACVIASGCRDAKTGVGKLLARWPMQTIGRISYAWYLWHWPVLLLGHALTGSNVPEYRAVYVIVSLVFAFASYYCIEAPIRHQRWWMTHQRAAIYGTLMLIAFCIFCFLRWNGKAFSESHSQVQEKFVKAQLDAPIIYGMGCDEWYHSDRLTPCIFGPGKAAHTAVLVGDSIAGQWFPAMAALFVGPDWRLIVLTKSSCPMVDQSFFYPRIGREYTECAAWRKKALKEIAELKPDVALVSSAGTYGFTQKQWVDGSTKVLKEISSAAPKVFVFRPTPVLPFDGPDCLARYAERPDWLKLGSDCSATATKLPPHQVYAWLQQASEHLSNVQVVDVRDLVCRGGICSAERSGMVIFRDSQHITASFAASLAPRLRQLLSLNDRRTDDGEANSTAQP